LICTVWFFFFLCFFCSTVLIEIALFCTLTGEDLLSNFADEAQGEIMVVDFLVHCLRHDDIVHKVDSVGYRVFLTTTFFVSYFDTLVFVHPYNILYFSGKTMPSDRLNYFFILFFSLLFQSVQEFWMMIHLRRLSLLKCGELLNLSCSTMICPRQNWLAVSYTLYFFCSIH